MEPEIEELLERVREQQRRIEETQRSVARMVITGRSSTRDVTATVTGDGTFTEIFIDPSVVRSYDGPTVGRMVKEAVNDALRRLNEANWAEFAPIIQEAEEEAERS